ncbi:transposase family protein [Microbispora tritici]|uniref:Transposase family protein n=1 Tax=Microbispora tritici TaxID=2604471 RepID=A0ABY3LMD5_9ACTN|nr:transposase family protein [Microbispora tritici]TYB42593.1 transposase family protein [Microbispora tritici]
MAANLQISDQTIYNWRRQERIDAGLEPGIASSDQAELLAARHLSYTIRVVVSMQQRCDRCGSTTVERYQDELRTLIDMVLSPLYEAQAHRDAVLVDGLVVPVGERDGIEGLYSDKKGYCGQNVQVVATLSGRLADVGAPCPGSMHDSQAFRQSGSPRGGRRITNRMEWE